MLRLLSGRVHQVITGVCLVVGGQCSVASETTFVTMSEITEKEIADYVASGEPMDKAGAYAIQGIASMDSSDRRGLQQRGGIASGAGVAHAARN
jgi:septum formation protein